MLAKPSLFRIPTISADLNFLFFNLFTICLKLRKNVEYWAQLFLGGRSSNLPKTDFFIINYFDSELLRITLKIASPYIRDRENSYREEHIEPEEEILDAFHRTLHGGLGEFLQRPVGRIALYERSMLTEAWTHWSRGCQTLIHLRKLLCLMKKHLWHQKLESWRIRKSLDHTCRKKSPLFSRANFVTMTSSLDVAVNHRSLYSYFHTCSIWPPTT